MCPAPAGFRLLLLPFCYPSSSVPAVPSLVPLSALGRFFFCRRPASVLCSFSYPPSCMNAQHNNTGPLLLRHPSCLCSSGPLAPVGLVMRHSPTMPAGLPCCHPSAFPTVSRQLSRAFLSSPSLLLLSGLLCAPLLLSSPRLYHSRPHTPLRRHPILLLIGQLARAPRVPF